MHAGTPEARAREERGEKLRQAGLKNQESQGPEQVRRANIQLSHDVKDRRLQDLAQARIFREIAKRNKGSAIKKTLAKHK